MLVKPQKVGSGKNLRKMISLEINNLESSKNYHMKASERTPKEPFRVRAQEMESQERNYTQIQPSGMSRTNNMTFEELSQLDKEKLQRDSKNPFSHEKIHPVLKQMAQSPLKGDTTAEYTLKKSSEIAEEYDE